MGRVGSTIVGEQSETTESTLKIRMAPKFRTLPSDASIRIPFRVWNRMVRNMYEYHCDMQEALAAVEMQSREGFAVQVNREVGSVAFAEHRTRYEYEHDDVAEEIPFEYVEDAREPVNLAVARAHEEERAANIEVDETIGTDVEETLEWHQPEVEVLRCIDHARP